MTHGLLLTVADHAHQVSTRCTCQGLTLKWLTFGGPHESISGVAMKFVSALLLAVSTVSTIAAPANFDGLWKI